MKITSFAVTLICVSLALAGTAVAAVPQTPSAASTQAVDGKADQQKSGPAVTTTDKQPKADGSAPAAGTKADGGKAEAGAAPAQTKPKEAVKPVPTGLDRMSDDWPKWLRVGIQYRGRTESARALAPASAPYDGYYLNRIRLRATARVRSWLSATFEAQDSQVLAYDTTAPKNMYDGIDLRQANVEIATSVSGANLVVRAGRQEMAFGEGRLIASSDWGNTNRTWDVARVGVVKGGVKVDVFGGAIAQIQPGFNKSVTGERLYGAYVVLGKLVPNVSIEPFTFVRTIDTATGELGAKGDAAVYTFGTRATYRTSKTTDVGVEVAVQRGHQASDDIAAWAQHTAFTWKPVSFPWRPQVSVEYNSASGDSDSRDGRRQTFDQLYASMHGKFGIADRIAWRNMRHAGVSGAFAPAKSLGVGGGVHHLSVATKTDAYYGSSGSKVAFNKTAASRHIGWEGDGWMTWTISKELAVTGGVGVLFVGDYLKPTTQAERLWSPFLMWTLKL